MQFVHFAGLAWKLNLGFAIIATGMVILVLSRLFSTEIRENVYPLLLAIGVLVSAGSLAWLCLSVRCPRCGRALFWDAMTKRGSLIWLYQIRSCPECEFGEPHDDYRILRP